MILREVHLENVKSYGSPAAKIQFTRGVNAICGPNGVGKSTILEAIGCALYQHLPYKHEEFVREGEASGSITVVVESRLDGRTYEIVRKVGRGGAHFVHDPDLKQQIARGEAEVRQWLHQHLQIPDNLDLRSLFVDAVGPPQGTLTAVFLDSPQERRSKFHRLLRVDEYDEAFRKLATLETALDKERNDLQVEIARLDGQTRDRSTVELRLRALRDERADLAIRLSRALAQRDVFDKQLVEFDHRKQEWDAAHIAFEAASTEERHALARLVDSARAYDAARSAAETCRRTRGSYDAYHACESALIDLESQRRERDALRQQRSDLQRRIVQAQGEVDKLDAEIARLEKGLAEAERLEAKIPEQEVAEKRLQEAVAAVQAVERLKVNLKKAQQDIERVGDRGRRLQAEINRVSVLRSVADDLPRRKSCHEELSERLGAANRAYGELQQLRQSIQRDQRRLDELKARADDFDRRIAEASLLAAPSEPVAALETRLREVTEARASARSQLGHARETRGQVAGGLCPFLHEECRNLRPGVDLASHFDAEVARWHREFERLESDYASVDLATRRARQAEENRLKVAQLTSQRADLLPSLEETQKHLSEAQGKLREAAGLASSRTELEGAVRTARDEWQAAEQAARDLERLPDLEREIQEARGEWSNLKAQQEADRAQLLELANADAEVRAAQEALRDLGSPRERARHLREEARALPARREGRAGKGDAVDALQNEQAILDEQLAARAGLDERLEENRRRRGDLHADYLAYLKSVDVAATLDEQAGIHADAKVTAQGATGERERAEAALANAAASFDRAEHENQRQRRGAIDQTIGETRARIDAAESEDETLLARMAELDRLVEEQAELARHVDSIDEEKQIAGALRNAIRAAGPEITRQLLARISQTASRINGEVLNQAGIEVEWNPDFEIVTRRQGESRGFSQLSGGEQMAAALAVRLALLRELSKGRIAFLDEPTAHLDQERRSNLGDQVQRLQGFDQLIVISHDDTFDGLFGHVIRIGREDGRSKVVENE